MQKLKTLVVWSVLIGLFVVALSLSQGGSAETAAFDTFLEHLNEGQVQGVRIDGNEIAVTLWGGYEYVTLGLIDDDLTRRLSESGVVMAWGEKPRKLRTALLVIGPLVIFLALFVYFLRKQAGSTTNILSIRKSTARVVGADQGVTFEQVGGCEDAKEQLRDVIDFLKHPERWTEAGVRLPRGVLLEGPPGCGKTLLARAVAGETDAKFFLVSASEFVEMFVGVGAARVRDTFELAAKEPPAVIFVDEIDAVGRKRGSGVGAAHDEREQTLNQILVCLDGFEHADRVCVIAATNRADVLDPALLRAGRFDRRISIPALSRDQRLEVLRIHTREKPLDESVSLDAIADRTAGLSGADLENLANEAGLLAVRRLRRGSDEAVSVRLEDFEAILTNRQDETRRFDSVDALLVESTTQLAQPTGKARVRLTLYDGPVAEGELVWADARYLKLAAEDGSTAVFSKLAVKVVEALDGTAWVGSDDVSPDRWAGHRPDCA